MKTKAKVSKKKNYNKFFSYVCQERQKRNFSYKDFSYSKSYNTKFTGSLFLGNNFFKARMKYCCFNSCSFKFIEFNNVNFCGSRFKNAVFENVWFNHCELTGADFSEAFFTNVFFTGTSIKNIKNFPAGNNNFTQFTMNDASAIELREDLINALELCKKNKYIWASGTLFYKKKKNSYSSTVKAALKQLPKKDRKNYQRQMQLESKANEWQIHYINIHRLLKVYTQEDIINGLQNAANLIAKNFTSLSYFLPYLSNNGTVNQQHSIYSQHGRKELA